MKVMHSLFNETFPELQVSCWYYYNDFTGNYFLRFDRPQVDVRSRCEELKTKVRDSSSNDNAKRVADGKLTVNTHRYQIKLREIGMKCN